MTDYYILSRPERPLDIAVCAQAVERVTKLILYKGSCLYLPAVGEKSGDIILAIDQKDARATETDWFLRNLAGELSATVKYSDGGNYFDGSPDNSLDFLDMLPPPEEELQGVHIMFTIEGLPKKRVFEKICRFFDSNGCDVNAEEDGVTVFLGSNAFLDLFCTDKATVINGTIDCSFAGAGIYAEAVELTEALTLHLSAKVTFVEGPDFTYTVDRDFDKLRRLFYQHIAQQLAFAVHDDRDGLPAYLGWGTDSFEPEYIPGSLVTTFGRYDIARILSAIEAYGLSYVCDRYFLTRNTPTEGWDYYLREALNLVWNSTVGGKDGYFNVQEMFAIGDVENCLEMMLTYGEDVPFPKALYERLCSYNDRPRKDHSKNPDCVLDYEPGYARGEVSYGFGHYLRRFKLPGSLVRDELERGEEVFFHGDPQNGFKLMAEITYNYSGDGTESPLGHNWALGSADDIETFDIGGSSVVRFLDGGMTDELYRAEAEVYILDEVYRFVMVSKSHEDVSNLRDILRGSISVEDWYDEVIRESSPDPHAPGATFCTCGPTPECKTFMQEFPKYPNYFLPEAFNPSELPDIISALGGEKSNDPEQMMMALFESIAGHIHEQLDEEDEDEEEEGAFWEADDGE